MVTALLLAFAGYIPALMGVTDPAISALAVSAIRIVSVTLVASSLKYLFTSYYILQEKVWLSVLMTFVSDFAGVLLFGVPLALAFGIDGLWIGFAAAPVVALACGLLAIFARYGKASDRLLLPPGTDENIASFNLTLSEESIMRLRDDVEALLKQYGTPQNIVYRVMLIIEEVCNLILLKNSGKKVYMECTVMNGQPLKLILRDSGVTFNITDADMEVSSWSAYVVSGMMEKQKNKRNLTTTGYNRNEFKF